APVGTGRLPRAAAPALGASAAAAYTRLSSRRRAILLDNLRRAFPEKTPHEIETIARDSVRSFGAVLMDFLALSRSSEAAIRSRVRIVNREIYDGARGLHR